MMRSLVVIVMLALLAVANGTTLSERIMDERKSTDDSNDWVFAEIVDPNGPENEEMEYGDVPMSAVEVEDTLSEEATPTSYYPGGHYGQFSYPAAYMHPYIGGAGAYPAPDMRFASMQAAPVGGPLQPYAQYGFPYSAYPPIPPPMPTYLPPPPYIPLPQGAEGGK